MKMSFNQAQQILDALGIVLNFVEPGPDVSESVADAMFRKQERAEKALDGIVMNLLREMVIAEAKEVRSAHVRR